MCNLCPEFSGSTRGFYTSLVIRVVESELLKVWFCLANLEHREVLNMVNYIYCERFDWRDVCHH